MKKTMMRSRSKNEMVVSIASKILALVCFIQVCAGAKKWEELSVRFDLLKPMGFHRIPTKTTDRLIKDYVKVEPEEGFKLPVDFYCYPNDPRACFMFDKRGNVVGIQISFLKADMAKVNAVDYDYAASPNYVETNFFGIPAWSFRAYITNPEKLTENGRVQNGEIGDGLWTYIKGELVEIPRKMPQGDRFGDFHKQGCMKSMGQHFFYDVYKNLPTCKELFALFPLYEDGYLVGYGLATPGSGTAGRRRDWYEYPPKLALSIITPNRPQCLDKLVDKYGLTSMHVYFVKRPYDISCTIIGKAIGAATGWLPF